MNDSSRLSDVDTPRTLARAALVAGLTVVGVGCTITPSEEVQSPTPVRSNSTGIEPETLAFNDEPDTVSEPAVEPVSVSAAIEPAGSSSLLEIQAPAAFLQITDSARIGVHSAPDAIYTRIGILEPGAGVLATGRRADVGGIIWMEISCGDATGWVVEAASPQLIEKQRRSRAAPKVSSGRQLASRLDDCVQSKLST